MVDWLIISLHVSVFLYSCLVSRTVGNEADSALESDELYSTVGGRLARRLCPRQDVTMRLFFNKRAIITIMKNLHLSTGATECSVQSGSVQSSQGLFSPVSGVQWWWSVQSGSVQSRMRGCPSKGICFVEDSSGRGGGANFVTKRRDAQH